ncbi:hypothetical protein OG966_28145 [Streptomyces sp. NBC_01750]|nr:hypothetical protein OG966_28145 [Streptomyces sp. NBC_01750]
MRTRSQLSVAPGPQPQARTNAATSSSRGTVLRLSILATVERGSTSPAASARAVNSR